MPNIVFIHPDLGIGGAERAMVDAALALKGRGHNVQFLTSHHDRNHCFNETIDGTLYVTVAGNWLPKSTFGLFCAMWAYIRMIYASIYLIFFSGINFDLIFCDQIAACIPIIKMFSTVKIVFYCHFPDMLLTNRTNAFKMIYRKPLDFMEEYGTGKADLVLVNSKFTAEVFKCTFKSLSNISPEVLYPIPNFEIFSKVIDSSKINDIVPPNTTTLFLSINRYERKKNLALALKSLSLLENINNVHLIIAGGYDENLIENRDHYIELLKLCKALNLCEHVTFLRSISLDEKIYFIKKATCLLYTPSNEHFGIVPIESMLCGTPVIAINSGGPLETISNNETGLLVNSNENEFAKAMQIFIDEPKLKTTMGEAAIRRIKRKFSFDEFSNKLDHIVHNILYI